MKKVLLGLTILMLSCSAVWANLFEAHNDFGSEIETDKMVYEQGETLYLTIYVNNKSEFGMQRAPELDVNDPLALHLHSDPALSGGGEFFRQIVELPAKEYMGISAGDKRPYFAYSFALLDEEGNPLPPGYYALSHSFLGFKDNALGITRYTNSGTRVFFIRKKSKTYSIPTFNYWKK